MMQPIYPCQMMKSRFFAYYYLRISRYDVIFLKVYPLPEDHWINQPLESENCLTLLQLSVCQERPDFTGLLVRAGARADQYNDMLDTAVIHTAILEGHGEQHLVALFDDSRYEITN